MMVAFWARRKEETEMNRTNKRGDTTVATHRSRLRISGGIGALAALLAVALPNVAHAAPTCDLSSFKGVYGVVAHGLIINEPPIPPIFNGPVVRVGRAESAGRVMRSTSARNTDDGYRRWVVTE